MRRVVLSLLPWLAGCDLVFLDAPASCTGDEFDGAEIDLRTWDVQLEASLTVQQRGGELVIEVPAATSGYSGLTSTAPFDATGKAIELDVTASIAGGDPAAGEVIFALRAASDVVDRHIIVGNEQLSFRSQVDHVDQPGPVRLAYVPDAHRHWRMVHDPATNRVLYETSADREVWIERNALPAAIDLSHVRVSILAGAYFAGLASPSAPRFAAFRVCDRE